MEERTLFAILAIAAIFAIVAFTIISINAQQGIIGKYVWWTEYRRGGTITPHRPTWPTPERHLFWFALACEKDGKVVCIARSWDQIRNCIRLPGEEILFPIRRLPENFKYC